jgi:hypothetical protein
MKVTMRGSKTFVGGWNASRKRRTDRAVSKYGEGVLEVATQQPAANGSNQPSYAWMGEA